MNIIANLLNQTEKIDFLFPQNFEQLMNDSYFDYDKFEWFLYYVFKFDKNVDVRKIGSKGKGDGGADLILSVPQPEGGRLRIGIQAKYWKNRVGTAPINQLASAKARHDLTHLWIITTSDLTTDAKEIAESLDIKILRKDDVINLIEQVKQKHEEEIVKTGESSIEFLPLKKSKEKPSHEKGKQKKVDSSSQDDLREELRKLRINISKKNKLFPVYHVFNNETLDILLEQKPSSLKELENIPGMGPVKIKLFGQDLIDFFKNTDSEDPLEKILKEERIKISKYNRITIDNVYNDEMLLNIIKQKPKTKEELLAIPGFDDKRLKIFGDYLISLLNRLY